MKISYFTISNIIKKYKLFNVYYKYKSNTEIIKCTTSNDKIPRKFRTLNINSNRIRDLGLLEVFDLTNKVWRTLLIPCIRRIEADVVVYKFGGK